MRGAVDLSASPQRVARIGGLLYLFIIISGLFAEVFVRGELVVSGKADATAVNIRASEMLWRLGIAVPLVHLICAVALGLIFYVLLRPVSRDLALLAVLFNLVSIAVEAVGSLFLLAPLFVLGNAEYLRAVPTDELNALAYVAVRVHGHCFGVSLIFFGCECLVLGYLILRSEYFPKLIGILMQLAGVAYLVNSYTLLLAPVVANRMFPFILLPPFIGELSLCLWLLVKGVNVAKWNVRTAQAPRVAAVSS